MASVTVHVSNIAPSTTEAELSSFFSFCGNITALALTPASGAPGAPQSATITFNTPAAASTAVLLDGTALSKEMPPLHVTAAPSIDEIAGSHVVDHDPADHPQHSADIPQDAKPRSAVLAEYLASGYVIGDAALQRGIELDTKHGLSARFAGYLHKLDARLHASDRARSAEAQYQIGRRATDAQHSLSRYFENAAGSPLGRKVRGFYLTGEKQVLDIHNEARRLAELKKARASSGADDHRCTCDPGAAADGTCNCEPGRCDCDGCKKKTAAAASTTAAAAPSTTAAAAPPPAYPDEKATMYA